MLMEGQDPADRLQRFTAVKRSRKKPAAASGLLGKPIHFLVASIAPGPTPSLDVADEASGRQSRHICPRPIDSSRLSTQIPGARSPNRSCAERRRRGNVNDGLRLYNISTEDEESVEHCYQKQFLEIPD
jgi:hypothetical protein